MLALLHTSQVHVPTFDRLRDEVAPSRTLYHIVAEHLLDEARRSGPAAVAAQVAREVERAAELGARAVLCTCSTIGELAEQAARQAGIPVLRVDRPMAAAAVAAGARITVLAALSSTLEPTTRLIEEEAARAGRGVSVSAQVIAGAWDLFEAGDVAGYLDLVVEALAAVTDADVIVLAQASMEPAAEQARTSIPVVSSPRSGLRAAMAL
ncbi:aspartate/glutamate racemase family protein [Catellatospora sp. KI3]|uniref:aspartate/glutamate racemase family protein n=1 Tax=Catellatospora sp. KI3 TaxID=3041620 RepID=UPI002482D67C|nr:aspartate/glutamate racemase family protein [Catellatospora sp. KI3]MDI1462568.1 aspartate/glutamate racemase family protein [Catellatospora sp. KI3]